MTKEQQCQCKKEQDKHATCECGDHCECQQNGECQCQKEKAKHEECACGHHHHHHEHDGCGCGGHHHHQHEHDGCGCGGHHHHHHHEHHGCGCGHHHGADALQDKGITVQFNGVFSDVTVEQVWETLTQNEKVQQWYPELEFEGVETGATLRFNYQTGGSEEMMVLDVEAPHYLSFTWDLNIVTFELATLENGEVALMFTEWIAEVNDHSPKDLTGWMIALQSMAEVLEGKPVSDREERFHEFYPRIKEMLEQQTDMEFED